MSAADKVLALAFQERGSRFDLHRVATRAEKTKAGYRVTGAKAQVMGGYAADAFVVVARTSGEPTDAHGITLLLCPAGVGGVRVVRQHLVDGRNAVHVEVEHHALSTWIWCAFSFDQFNLVGQMIRVVRTKAAKFIQQVACDHLGLGVFHAVDHTVAYCSDRFEPSSFFEPINQEVRR